MSRKARSLFLLLSLITSPPWAWSQTAGTLRVPVPGSGGAALPEAPRETALVAFEGFVEVQRAGQQTRQQVRAVPLPLGPGDRIHTYRRGEAVLQFRDGSQVTLAPYTIFTLEEEQSTAITLNLALGKLRALVSKLKSRQFRVRTAVAVASVRGTEFEVEATPNRRANVAVHEGLVAVANLRGDELILGASQRVNVFEDRMGRIEFFEARPTRGGKEGRREDRRRDRDERRRSDARQGRSEELGRLKSAMEREIGFAQSRDGLESHAAFEQKNAVYQEGKTLVDAFGQRVRLEEYMLRPAPDTFKFVSLNFRDQRLDKGTFEVTANAPLPKDLKEAGNLWFSPTGNKPAFWALKTRFTLTNGVDSVTRMALDGDSLRIEIPGQPLFDPGTGTFVFSPGAFHQTVFGHLYEFINGDPAALNNIFFGPPTPGPSRPNDLASMMWHMVPVKVDLHRADDSLILAPSGQPFHFFDYAFLTGNGAAGTTGKMFVDFNFSPIPGLAHFIEFRSYLNFADSGGTGGDRILDFGEQLHPGDAYGVAGGCVSGTGPGCVYDDRVAIGQWNPTMNAGKGGIDFGGFGMGIPILGLGTRQPTGDSVVFVDGNNNGIKDGPEASTITGPLGAKDPGLLTFAHSNFRAFQESENFIIDDFGAIQLAPSLAAAAGPQQNQVGQLFQSFNFERTVRSNLFQGRKIDLVMTPQLFLQSGQLSAQQNQQGAPTPGGNAPGAN